MYLFRESLGELKSLDMQFSPGVSRTLQSERQQIRQDLHVRLLIAPVKFLGGDRG